MATLKGQQIAKNRSTTIKALNRAAAAELQAAHYYRLLSVTATGLHGREVAEMFGEMSDHEWKHAGSFMERIVQLGGVPFEKLNDAEKLSFGRVPRLPKSSSDWKRMVKDALQLEQEAITFYNQLLDDVHGDAVTQHLVREALEDEVKDEHELASLLE
jgi:ferritin-like protein